MRKKFLILAFFIGFILGIALSPSFLTQKCPVCAYSVSPIFSPPAEEELLKFVESAKESIEIQLFEFSNQALKEALAKAVEKGVLVRVILDPKVDLNLKTAEFLEQKGIQVRWSSPEFVYTHSKTAVVDKKKVLVGSINWSRNAVSRNRESAVIIESPETAKEFLKVFERDWQKGVDAKS